MKKITIIGIALVMGSYAQAALVSATYASGDAVVINQVKSDGTLTADDRPNVGAFATGGFNGFWFFELPTLAAGESIDAAAYANKLKVITDKGGLANFDLYAYGSSVLGAVSNDYQVTTGVAGSGDNAANWVGTRVADDLLTPTTYVDEQIYTVTDGSLLSVIQGLYAGGTAPTETYLVLRGQMDWDTDVVTDTQRYRFNSHADVGPSLLLNVIPEPATMGMVALFGSGLLFIRRRFTI